MTGLSRSTTWRMQRTGAFPRSIALSPGRVGWRESELAAWPRPDTDPVGAFPQAATGSRPPEPDRLRVLTSRS